MSVRTTIRDRIVADFQAMQQDQSGRVKDFDVRMHWITDQETTRACTYCVVVTDETRAGFTLTDDRFDINGVVVLYAYDTRDARATLDQMIEDAIDIIRVSFRALEGVVQRASLDTISVSEGSTAEGEWPQAVIRWRAQHIRVGVL